MPTNAWFDSEFNELRKTINTYAKQSNLTHTENNNYYHNLCNNYKRMIKRKKQNYNTNLKLNLKWCVVTIRKIIGVSRNACNGRTLAKTQMSYTNFTLLFSKTKWATYRSKRKYKIQNYTTKNTHW